MLYFITVNYRSKHLIKELIKSITTNSANPYKLIIVNNSPEETSIHDLVGDSIEVLETGDNIGFGQACNRGLQYIYQSNPSALVWLINPDATLEPQADSYILACLQENPTVAILGTRIKDTGGQIWFASGAFNKWTGYVNHRTLKENSTASSQKLSPTPWVSGCSMVINLAIFSECPVFDPGYFLYFEDADFCIRQARQGYSVAITDVALVNHQVSAIIGKNQKFMFNHYTYGRLLFLRQHATFLGFYLYLAYLLAKIITLSAKEDTENALGRWQGVKDFFRNKRPDKP